MTKFRVEMNFCRRCGTVLTHKQGNVYECKQAHLLYLTAPPSVAIVLLNDKHEILISTRAIEPGKGLRDVPGGFCDIDEPFETALAREIREEVGLTSADYTEPRYFTSVVGPYDYKGETLLVMTAYFVATITSKTPLAPADDVKSLAWVSLARLKAEELYFPSDRIMLARLQAKHVYNKAKA